MDDILDLLEPDDDDRVTKLAEITDHELDVSIRVVAERRAELVDEGAAPEVADAVNEILCGFVAERDRRTSLGRAVDAAMVEAAGVVGDPRGARIVFTQAERRMQRQRRRKG